jgi:uncharacterized membrane protein
MFIVFKYNFSHYKRKQHGTSTNLTLLLSLLPFLLLLLGASADIVILLDVLLVSLTLVICN